MSDDPYVPNSTEVEHDRALDLLDQGCIEEAERILVPLLSSEDEVPGPGVIHINLGWCRLRMEQADAAVEHFLRAHKLFREQGNRVRYMDTLNSLGAAYLELDDAPEAMRYLDEGLKYIHHFDDPVVAVPRFHFWMNRARALFAMDQWNKSLIELRKARKVVREEDLGVEHQAILDLVTAETHVYAGNPKIAAKYLSSVETSELDEYESGFYYLTKLRICGVLKDHEGVLSSFGELQKIGISEESSAEVYSTVGIAHYHLGNRAEAMQYFHQSQEHDPTPDIRQDNLKYLKLLEK